jgi:hypothetical protein
MLRRLTYRRPLWSVSLFAALALLMVASTGCKSWGRWGLWDDSSFPEEDQKLLGNLRPPEPNSAFAGTSNKAQQIERNFGIGPK